MHKIVIFGKGYGESILFSVGKDKFILIDSFLDEETQKPVAIKYLESKGLSVNNICGIICTHWDDDHTKGMAEIIRKHSGQLIFYSSKIFLEDNFIRLISFLKKAPKHDGNEFSEVLSLIGQKKVVFNDLICDRLLFNNIVDKNVQIRALSPNDKQISSYMSSLYIPKVGASKNMNAFTNNNISAVTLLKIDNDYALFGGDFENSSLNSWDYISSQIRNFEKSKIFKIPHHGSKTSYCKEAWLKIVDAPMSAVTRFNRKMLPRDDMLKEIKSLSSSVFVIGRKSKRDEMLKKEFVKFLRDGKLYSFVPSTGYVEFVKKNNKWISNVAGDVEIVK